MDFKYFSDNVNDNKKGAKYRTATSQAVVDLGEKRVLVSSQGVVRGLKGRSVDVSKMLLSVYDMCKAGHRVVFDLDGSFAEHKTTGQKTNFILRNNTWDLDLEIVPYTQAKAADYEKDLSAMVAPLSRPALQHQLVQWP